MNKKQTLSVIALASFLSAQPALSNAATQKERGGNEEKGGEIRSHMAEVHQSLKELEHRRAENLKRLREARAKEQAELAHLSHIKQHLQQTKDKLEHSEQTLKKTEHKIDDCERKIEVTQTEEGKLTDAASQRLREIYEGQRLGLLEMMFQVSSLQGLLDLFYFEERIAAVDRQIITGLRARASALSARRNQLGSQKSSLGDMVSEFARKALQLNKEKNDHEHIADALRTQRAFYENAERQLAQESQALERQIVQMCASKSAVHMTQGSGQMSMPLRAAVTSPFGIRRHPIFGVRKFHTGIDLGGPNHSEIHAADSGSVLFSGWYGGYGKVVIVSHGKGMATLYAHLAKAAVSAGQNVSKGQVVGYEGTTGFSTGPHLHFEVRVDGKPNNPLNFVR